MTEQDGNGAWKIFKSAQVVNHGVTTSLIKPNLILILPETSPLPHPSLTPFFSGWNLILPYPPFSLPLWFEAHLNLFLPFPLISALGLTLPFSSPFFSSSDLLFFLFLSFLFLSRTRSGGNGHLPLKVLTPLKADIVWK